MIKREIQTVAKRLNLRVSFLEHYKTKELINQIYIKFVDKALHGNFLWENLSNCMQITDYMGWSYLGNFIMDNECIMLFYDESGWNAVEILTGYDLVNISGESFAFEFYVVDNRLTYLLCFLHEDQLIGAGRAKEWISKLENTKYGRR